MAESGGPVWPSNEGSIEAQKFLLENNELISSLKAKIETAFSNHDGGTILLWDAALRGMVAGIADGLSQCKIRVETDADSTE